MIINGEIERPDLNLLELNANVSDYSAITDLFLCLPTFYFDTVTDFIDRDKWNEGIVAKNIIPIHDIFDVQDQSEQIAINESKHNYRVKIKPGKYRFLLSLCVSIDFYKDLKKYEGQNIKCYVGDINGNLYGVMSGDTVVPFDIDPIIIDKINWGTSSNPSWTNILLGFLDPDQMLSAYISKVDWELSGLYNIECTLTLTSNYSTVFESDFSSWVGDQPDEMTVTDNGSAYAQDNNNQFESILPGVGDWVQLTIDNPLNTAIGGVTYKLTLDLISCDDNAVVLLYWGGGAESQQIAGGIAGRTPGEKSVTFSYPTDHLFYLYFAGGIASEESIVIDNYKLESLSGEDSITFTASRADGDPITNLTKDDLTIVDDINGSVTITTLTETSAGTYTLVPAEVLSTGTITLLSDNYNGEYEYDL